MKKALLKNSIIEIKKSFKRFLSILIMALLGVGFFSGLRSSSPDMQKTLDSFFDSQNAYDIEVISTLGLTDEDVSEIEKIEGVKSIKPVYSEDIFIDKDGKKDIIKVLEYTKDINKPVLIEGKFPENSDECVIDLFMNSRGGFNIGDTITIEENLKKAEKETDEDETPTFKNSNLKIVGVVTTPLYLSSSRGSTTLGDGSIDYFIYVNRSAIDSDIYTSIYLTVEDATYLDSVGDEYKSLIKNVKDRLENIKEERQKARYTELIDEANKKLDDAEKELETEKNDAEKKIADAEKDIADGKKEISDNEKKIKNSEKELSAGKAEADAQFADAEIQLGDAQNKIILSQEELDSKKAEFEGGKKALEDGIKQLEDGISTIDFQIAELTNQKNALIASGMASEIDLGQIDAGIAECNNQKAPLQAQLEGLKTTLTSSEMQLTIGQSQLTAAWNEIQAKKAELANKKQETYQDLEKAEKEIKDGKKELNDAKKELEDGEKELEDKKIEFNEKIADAEQKIIDAREKINDIKNAKWYIWDRQDLEGFNAYTENITSIKRIAQIFPIVFFVVAVLISLTSMTRMVEEERTQIGTLKALGYSKFQIVQEYLIYAALATVIGGTIGIAFGMKFFPSVIIFLYEMMFIHMTPVVPYSFTNAILGLAIMLACMLGATVYTALKELNLVPAELMRPKAPKVGKRVFLENIKFIWNNLNFTQKVTIRNMFRYKKRFLMTVIGITGCTSLILAGYALKDSISYVLDAQYENVFHYNMMIALNDTVTPEETNAFEESLKQKPEINNASKIYTESSTIEFNDKRYDVQLVVVRDVGEFEKLISLKDVNNNKAHIKLDDNSIIITDKLADLLETHENDTITLLDLDKEEYATKVGKTAEHYVSHYLYMTEKKYKEIFDKECIPNVIYIQYADNVDKGKEEQLSEEILKDSRTLSVVLTSAMAENINTIIQSLDVVTYVLIVSAGLLAFVVLYNLANVNISERIRELATIKVLGFYDKEVYDYIARETTLLTIIGIILGLFGGYLLNQFILVTCEVDMLRFPLRVKEISFVISILITTIFTIIVNFMTYFSLKKIDMIESLKSIE